MRTSAVIELEHVWIIEDMDNRSWTVLTLHVSHIVCTLYLTPPVAADVNLIWPQVPVMVQLVHTVGSDDEHSDSLVASAAGLLG